MRWVGRDGLEDRGDAELGCDTSGSCILGGRRVHRCEWEDDE